MARIHKLGTKDIIVVFLMIVILSCVLIGQRCIIVRNKLNSENKLIPYLSNSEKFDPASRQGEQGSPLSYKNTNVNQTMENDCAFKREKIK